MNIRLANQAAGVLQVGSGLILGLRPVNERRHYFVTTSLIGLAQAWNQPCWVNLDEMGGHVLYETQVMMEQNVANEDNQEASQSDMISKGLYYWQKLSKQPLSLEHW